MLGRLTVDAFPFHEPIIMVTLAIVAVAAVSIAAAITKAGKWQYLWTEWFTSVDHKKLGFMYIVAAMVMLIRGFTDAMLMRTQQFLSAAGQGGFLPPDHYDQIFTVHGVIMIFFVAMPLVIGLMNIAIPLQIGARDVAFPFLNNLSFWLFAAGAILTNISLAVGEFGKVGWLAYPPLSGIAASPDVGVDYWIWALQISGIGTTLTGVNFIVTILKMRTPSMPLMKMPVFTWASFCSNILIAISFPILTVSITLLTLDRYVGTHFFTNDAGGNMMMYINLIWMWGHPEVYILVLPVFGIFSEVTAVYSRKKLFGYNSLVWATVVITILSFIVWLHHFFTMGSGANVNAFFGIATMIISIPTGVKIFNWLFTMWRGRIQFTTPMLWTIGFLLTFTVGGMTGVLLSVPGADFVLHGSLFLVAHFHNVIIGGVVFGCFAGITYWFPKATGFMLDETWGKRAFAFWITGFFVAFMPLYALGFNGMARRLSQNIDADYFPMLAVASVGGFIIAAGVVCQVIQIIVSFRNREQNADTTGDPWDARTFEWSTSSPAPFYNFAHLPKGDEIDAFWYQKQRGEFDPMASVEYEPIHMPKNTPTGVYISAIATVFGFAMIWYIWWLAAISFVGVLAVIIRHSYNTDIDYYVQVDEIEKIEAARREQLKNAKPTFAEVNYAG